MDYWQNGEKELLIALHQKMGDIGFDWRDDCIICDLTSDLSLVYSIDSSRRWLSHNDKDDASVFGRWIASTITSDVISCGVPPRGLALDIGLRAFQGETELSLFLDGVLDVCREYGLKYEGGNLNRTNLVSGVSWGTSKPSRIIKRSGAQKDSVLLATAPIGVGWAYELLRRQEEYIPGSLKAPPEEFLKFVKSYKEKSTVNLDAFKKVWDLEVIDCGMDLTDGILEFAYEIYERTGLGIIVAPVQHHPFVEYMAARLRISPIDIILEPGYDTPLSHGWCIKKQNLEKVTSILEQYNVPYTIWGEVTDCVTGVFREGESSLLPLPRYWDDKCRKESSFDIWEKSILGKKLDFFPNGQEMIKYE